LAEDLARFLNREPVRARRISPVGRLWRVARRHPGITTVTTVASATVLAIATYAYVKILNERNVAVRASNDRAIALIEKNAEAEKAREAARWALFANASNLLLSELPDRRARGLDLLRQTADPEKAIELDRHQPLSQDQVHDSAVEFLVLRDVETRPEIPTGPTRGIEFGPGGTVLAALSEDGQEVSLWNMETRQRFATIALADGRVAGADPPHPPLRGTFSQGEKGSSYLLPRGEGGRRPDEGSSGDVAVAPPQPSTSASAEIARGTSSPGHVGNGSPGGRFRRPGGDRLALAGHNLAAIRPDDHGLRLFDLRTGSLLHDLDRADRTVLSIMANQASQRLLTVERLSNPTRPPGDGQIEVIVWDLNRIEEQGMILDRITPEPQRRWMPVAAAFGPDGRTVAIASNSKGITFTVSLYSAENGQEKSRLIDTQSETLFSLALGASSVLATGTGNTIQLWDREAGTLLSSLSSNRAMPRLLRFNPQGTLLAAAGGNHLEVWDTVSRKILAVLPPTDFITDVSFTPDGRTLAVGRIGSSTTVWQITDSATHLQLGGLDARPTALAFRSDGSLAIGATNGDVWLYHAGGNRCTSAPSGGWLGRSGATPQDDAASPGAPPLGGTTPHAGFPPTCGVGPCPSHPAVRSNSTPAQDRERERERGRWTSVAFDAKGRLMALDPRGLRLWPEGSALSQPPEVVCSQSPSRGRRDFPHLQVLARSADGQRMVVVRSSAVSLWRADQPERMRPISAPPMCSEDQGSTSASAVHPSSAAARHLLPEGEGVCSPSPSREKAAEGRMRGAPSAPHRDIFAVQIAPAGDRLYLLGDSGRLKIWTLPSDGGDGPIQARQLEPAEKLPEEFTSLALRSDGALLALGDRLGNITLFDTASLKIQARIRPPGEESQGVLLALAFSPDGRQLAAGSPQGQIIVWSLADPRSPQIALSLPGQRGMVRSLVFDATGQRLASTAGLEPSVEIWNLAYLESELRRLGLGR
jgi:WD40 repeat protein